MPQAEARRAVRTIRQLANRNLLVSLVLFAVLFGQVAFAITQAARAIASLHDLEEQRVQVLRFQSSLAGVLLPLNDYALTKNAADVKKIAQGRRDFRLLFARVSSLPQLGAGEKKRLAQVKKLVDEVFRIADDITKGHVPESQYPNLALVAQNLVLVAQRNLEQVSRALSQRLAGAIDERQQALRLQGYFMAGLVLLNIVVLVWLSRRFTSTVTSEIEGVARAVAEASAEIDRVVEQQTMVADLQAKSVTQVSEELQALSETAARVADTATSVEKLARATAATAVTGAKAVEETIAAMDEIRSEVEGISERVSESAQRIAEIVETIARVQEIADETHLLALNASIESAAAGEFGKRFAVVAEEVRRLADRTTEFTEEIQGVVEAVREAATSSAEAARHGLDDVRRGVSVVQRAGEVLRKMQEMSQRTEKAVRVIAEATRRQDEANRGFVSTMESIRGLLEDSARQMQTTREAVDRLNALAAQLAELVGAREERAEAAPEAGAAQGGKAPESAAGEA